MEDAAGAVSTSDPVTLTVNNINDPVYIDDGQTSLFRSEVLNGYQILISDEDFFDSYTFTATGLPSWMSLDPSTGVISGTPGRADDGVYDISITVEDIGGLTDTKTIRSHLLHMSLQSLGWMMISSSAILIATGLKQVAAQTPFTLVLVMML